MTIVSWSALSAPIVKSPLDVAAPADPKAAVTRLVGVGAIDKASGKWVTVGPWGKILISADSGKTWRQSAAPVSSDLVAVTFPTPEKGWAVGHDGVVLHSSDGGKTWSRQLDGRQYGDIMVRHYEILAQQSDGPKIARALEEARRFKEEGADKPFLDVWFENERSGCVVGAFNLILKTDDAGKTWQPWIDRIENENAYSLFAIGPAGEEVFIVGELGLVKRLDRRQGRFVQVTTPYTGSFFGLVGKPGTVIIFGLRGNAYRSRDSGKSWQKLVTGVTGGITAGSYLDDGRLVLVDNAGTVIVSTDDGDHFVKAMLGKPMGLNGITAIGKDSVLVVGERGVSAETINIDARKTAK